MISDFPKAIIRPESSQSVKDQSKDSHIKTQTGWSRADIWNSKYNAVRNSNTNISHSKNRIDYCVKQIKKIHARNRHQIQAQNSKCHKILPSSLIITTSHNVCYAIFIWVVFLRAYALWYLAGQSVKFRDHKKKNISILQWKSKKPITCIFHINTKYYDWMGYGILRQYSSEIIRQWFLKLLRILSIICDKPAGFTVALCVKVLFPGYMQKSPSYHLKHAIQAFLRAFSETQDVLISMISVSSYCSSGYGSG